MWLEGKIRAQFTKNWGFQKPLKLPTSLQRKVCFELRIWTFCLNSCILFHMNLIFHRVVFCRVSLFECGKWVCIVSYVSTSCYCLFIVDHVSFPRKGKSVYQFKRMLMWRIQVKTLVLLSDTMEKLAVASLKLQAPKVVWISIWLHSGIYQQFVLWQ